jgi:hypothetical protein
MKTIKIFDSDYDLIFKNYIKLYPINLNSNEKKFNFFISNLIIKKNQNENNFNISLQKIEILDLLNHNLTLKINDCEKKIKNLENNIFEKEEKIVENEKKYLLDIKNLENNIFEKEKKIVENEKKYLLDINKYENKILEFNQKIQNVEKKIERNENNKCEGFNIKNLNYLISEDKIIKINEIKLTKPINNENIIFSCECTGKKELTKLNICKKCNFLRKKIKYYDKKINLFLESSNEKKENFLIKNKINNNLLKSMTIILLKEKLKEKIQIYQNEEQSIKYLKKIFNENNEKKTLLIINFIKIIQKNHLDVNSFFGNYLFECFKNLLFIRNNNNCWSTIITNFMKVLQFYSSWKSID